jgi:transcriptional regulator with XRE-family HTH domain
MSISQLGAASGVSKGSLSGIECGPALFTIATLARIAQGLGVTSAHVTEPAPCASSSASGADERGVASSGEDAPSPALAETLSSPGGPQREASTPENPKFPTPQPEDPLNAIAIGNLPPGLRDHPRYRIIRILEQRSVRNTEHSAQLREGDRQVGAGMLL